MALPDGYTEGKTATVLEPVICLECGCHVDRSHIPQHTKWHHGLRLQLAALGLVAGR